MWTAYSDPQSILKCNILKSFKDETFTYKEIMGVYHKQFAWYRNFELVFEAFVHVF